MLSKEATVKYQQIYKKEFGEEIGYDQALEQGTKLLRLFGFIYQPIPKNWLKETHNKSNKEKRK